MDRDAYIAEADKQLNNIRHYNRLDQDLTFKQGEETASSIRTMADNGHISKETGKYLKPTNPRTVRFYHLPTIHKPGNPGRPIVSSCGTPTVCISEFVDYHLQPLVMQIPSYLQDTKDFLRKLSELGPPPLDYILLTQDVSSLYNIPHDEGIKACKLALEQWPHPDPPTASLPKMIKQILTMNSFKFNAQHYLQVQGTAMGTRMAPSYANILMRELEKRLLQNTTYKTAVWWRYIHDIFVLWNNGEEQLQTTARTHRVRYALTCKTKNLVYLIQCKKFGL